MSDEQSATLTPLTASNLSSGVAGDGHSPAYRAALSDALARLEFANRAGLSYSGRRDLYQILGYPRTLTIEDYRERYERGGIAEAIVEILPRATWGSGAAIVEDEDPNVITEFEAQVSDLFDRLNVYAQLLRVDILSGLGRYGALLLGVDASFDMELPRLAGPDSLIYLRPLAEDEAIIERIVQSPVDPRFQLPEYYLVSIGSTFGLSTTATISINKRVHWSRIIHIAEGALDSEVYGKPSLRSVWNYLDDLDKLVGGGAEAAWRNMSPGMNLKLDKDLRLSATEQQQLMDEIQDYVHQINPWIRTRGIDINQLSSTVQGFGGNADTIETLISGTKRIPKRILFGSERGELASSQDRDNFSDTVMARRREHATPVIRRFIGRLIDKGGLLKPSDYQAIWAEEEELDTAQKAEVVTKLAQANNFQFQAGGGIVITSDEIRDSVLAMEPLDRSQLIDNSSTTPVAASMSAKTIGRYRKLVQTKLIMQIQAKKANHYRKVFV